MDFLQLAQDRYSVRKFLQKPVSDEDLQKILLAGHCAPTACNKQPQRILIVNTPEGLEKLRMVTECHYNAPTALIVCYDKSEQWTRSYDGFKSGYIDASIVATHMMLEAASIGVGSTWLLYFIPEAVRVEFAVPDNYEIASILVMGYPADDAEQSPMHSKKRDMSETVFYGKY